MNTYSVARCISALVLVIAASVIGMPLPASASGEGKVVVSRHQALTINGRPLAQLLSGQPLPGVQSLFLASWSRWTARSVAWWWTPPGDRWRNMRFSS